MTRRVLIAGCGDVGTGLGLTLAQNGDEVHGLRRDASALPAPIKPLSLDLRDPRSLASLAKQWDAVVYLPTPDERAPEAYRATFVDGLQRLLDAVATSRLVFVSSTAVYGQNQGEWVDEDSATEPTAFNGQVLLEAEAVARSRVEQTTVIRFGGIYGPGRDRLLRVVRSGARVPCDPPQWTNRIHRDDCVAMLAFVLDMETPADCYVGTDDEPAPRHEVLRWLAALLDAPAPECTEAGQDLGKRCSNRRIRAAGFHCRYPDYRTGYRTLVDA